MQRTPGGGKSGKANRSAGTWRGCLGKCRQQRQRRRQHKSGCCKFIVAPHSWHGYCCQSSDGPGQPFRAQQWSGHNGRATMVGKNDGSRPIKASVPGISSQTPRPAPERCRSLLHIARHQASVRRAVWQSLRQLWRPSADPRSRSSCNPPKRGQQPPPILDYPAPRVPRFRRCGREPDTPRRSHNAPNRQSRG